MDENKRTERFEAWFREAFKIYLEDDVPDENKKNEMLNNILERLKSEADNDSTESNDTDNTEVETPCDMSADDGPIAQTTQTEDEPLHRVEELVNLRKIFKHRHNEFFPSKYCYVVVPTLYGNAALICSSTDMDENGCSLRGELHIRGFNVMPVFITDKNELIYSNRSTDKPYSDSDESYLLVYESQHRSDNEFKPNETYVIPLAVDKYLKENGICGTASENYQNICRQISRDYENRKLTFRLPTFGWKITKPGMRCRNKHYHYGWVTCEGEIALHKNGIHFAKNLERLKNWYKPFNRANEVYLVQIGPDNCISDVVGTSVTNMLYFSRKVDWDEILDPDAKEGLPAQPIS